MSQPTVSIVIPVLNSSKTLGVCLDSIIAQEYPKDKIEIVFADGGSTDGTIDLIKSKLRAGTGACPYILCVNSLKTGEAGKAVGVKQAKNEIILFIDSDNILPDVNWLQLMTEPFQDSEIFASEPIFYTYRKEDSFITRYCAMLGMNDPMCLFMGNYDRYSILTNTWTEVNRVEEDKGNYLKISFPESNNLPTIGANGFLIRKSAISKYDIGDYLFDIDIICYLVKEANGFVSKVKTGIIHIYCDKIAQFIRKQRRRVRDYNYYNGLGMRKFPWSKVKRQGILKFCIYTILILPLFFQAIKGFLKKMDFAWFFHPMACWITLIIYGWNTLKLRFVKMQIESRDKWRQ